MLVEVVVVAVVTAGVLAIGEKVGAMVEWVTLRPYILLRVGVLIGEEVLVRGGSIVVQAGIVQV